MAAKKVVVEREPAICYHCGEPATAGHDCWTTTEAALTAGLSEELRDAWQRLRETAEEFGEQRIYASQDSIMFSRKACYFFVRPKRKHLEVVVFLGREVKDARVHQVHESSKVKRAHVIRVTHRDEVERPLTDWLREAYDFAGLLKAPAATTKAPGAESGVESGKRASASVK